MKRKPEGEFKTIQYPISDSPAPADAAILRAMSQKSREPFSCPVCGEEVPGGAKSCPECGACERSGWGGEAGEGLGLPDADFDYDRFVEEEFGGGAKKSGTQKVWVAVAVLILTALAWSSIGGCWHAGW